MSSRSLSDFHVLVSIGMLPLVACGVDVGEGLTLGSLLTASDDGATGEDGDTDQTGDGSDGDDAATEGGDDGPPADGASADDAGDDDPGASGTDDAGTDDAAPQTGPAASGDESGDYGGMYAEICQTWAQHAQECGLVGDALGYCEYDVEYAGYLGAGCPAAIEDYYSCLVAADCAELSDPDASPCSVDAVEQACAG